jgi:hypothetical protein
MSHGRVIIDNCEMVHFSNEAEERADEKGKTSNVKHGLSEAQRQQVFEALMTAVDTAGEETAKKNRWPRIAAEYKIDVDTLEKILDEGFNSDWMQPAFSNYNAQAKYNRLEWIRNRSERQGNLTPRNR